MDNGIIFSDGGSVLTAFLSGEIDHHTAKEKRERTDEMLFKCRPEILVIDFSEVKFMDSSGIGFIIGRAEICSAMGAAVRLAGLNLTLRKLVKLSGIEKISNISVL